MGLRETNWHHRAPHDLCEEGILAALVLLQGESFLTEQKGCSPRWELGILMTGAVPFLLAKQTPLDSWLPSIIPIADN